MVYSAGVSGLPDPLRRFWVRSSMSQDVGHLREAAKDLTVPKMKAGFISSATKFPVKAGHVWIDTSRWQQIRAAVEEHSSGLIVDRFGVPALSLPSEEFATKDSELLACDVECRLAGVEGFYLELDIPGLNELIGRNP